MLHKELSGESYSGLEFLGVMEMSLAVQKEVWFRVQERLDYAVGDKSLGSLITVPTEPISNKANQPPRPVADESNQSFVTLACRQVLKLIGEPSSEPLNVSSPLEAFNHEHVDRKLLILGEPGAGKTTTLLTLAKELLTRTDEIESFPYIFELSAWKEGQDILPWMTAQLKLDYGINLKTSESWIKQRQLVPLLDGLDELNIEALPQCVAKINEFASAAGQQVVVCCRSEAYAQGQAKLTSLKGTLQLQPLDDEQIEQYLQQIGRRDIWQALQEQPMLATLLSQPERAEQEEKSAVLRVPLFLQMLVASYQPDMSVANEEVLLDAYVRQQLGADVRSQTSQDNSGGWAYPKPEDEPSADETKHYLSWLARRLQENNSTDSFFIAQMQPSWLETKAQRWQYRLIVGLIVGLLGGLVFNPTNGYTTGQTIGFVLVADLITGLIYGLLISLVGGLDKIGAIETIDFSFSRFVQKEFWNRFLLGFTGSLGGVLIIGLLVGLMGDLIAEADPTLSPGFDLTPALIFGLALSLIVGLTNGVKTAFQRRGKSNQRIASSIKTFLIITVSAFSIGVAINLWPVLATGQEINLQSDLRSSVIIACGFGLYLGSGLAIIQHLILRFLLHRQGHIPYNYAQFLRYTTERHLTQQIGGSFRFIHRELLDHFAVNTAKVTDRRNDFLF